MRKASLVLLTTQGTKVTLYRYQRVIFLQHFPSARKLNPQIITAIQLQ